MAGGALRIFLSAAIFVLTGVVMTISIQGVLYSGGGDRATFLLAIPNYLGITAVYFLGARCFRLLDSLGVWCGGGNDANRVHVSLYDKKLQPKLGLFETLFHRDRRKLFVLAFNETGGFLTGLTGLSIAGSGLYQVVFSGGTVFTALLTTFFLKKRLTVSQWLFVAVITAGLMITAEQVTHSASEAGAASLVSGLSFVLVSCLFYSTNYVIAEHVLDDLANDHDQESDTLPPPSGLDLSLYTGGSCLFIFGAYVLTYTVPNWKQLVVHSIEQHHGNRTIIVEEYIYLTVASFFHAITHYDVVASVGAVPIGVLNAIRAVSVFGVSSLFFCSNQASQCYNSRKGISTAVVILGAIGYSAASAAANAAKGYTKLSQVDAVATRTARKLKRAMSQSVDLSKSLSLSLLQGFEVSADKSFTLGSATGSSRKRKDSIQGTDG
ncbi:unnamed protein product [Agarophyton chilense]